MTTRKEAVMAEVQTFFCSGCRTRIKGVRLHTDWIEVMHGDGGAFFSAAVEPMVFCPSCANDLLVWVKSGHTIANIIRLIQNKRRRANYRLKHEKMNAFQHADIWREIDTLTELLREIREQGK